MKVLPCAKGIALYMDFLMFTLTAIPKIVTLPFASEKSEAQSIRAPACKIPQLVRVRAEIRRQVVLTSHQTLTKDGHPGSHIHSAVPLGRSI